MISLCSHRRRGCLRLACRSSRAGLTVLELVSALALMVVILGMLLVTLNKQGKAEEHRYLDRWIDEHTFQWSSQNSTTPDSKRGREIIEHEKRGLALHLFVRDARLSGGKAAPFTYFGKVRYRTHTGSAPMNVVVDVGVAE